MSGLASMSAAMSTPLGSKQYWLIWWQSLCSVVNCLDIRLMQLEGREDEEKMGEDENNEKGR